MGAKQTPRLQTPTSEIDPTRTSASRSRKLATAKLVSRSFEIVLGQAWSASPIFVFGHKRPRSCGERKRGLGCITSSVAATDAQKSALCNQGLPPEARFADACVIGIRPNCVPLGGTSGISRSYSDLGLCRLIRLPEAFSAYGPSFIHLWRRLLCR